MIDKYIEQHDKRKRCGDCLRLLKDGERKHKVKGLAMSRWPIIGDCCKEKMIEEENSKRGSDFNLI